MPAAGDGTDDVNRRIVEALRTDPRVRLIYLFGSRGRDEARAGSDWDVGIFLDRRPDWQGEQELRRRVAGFEEERVDLVILNDAGVVLRHEVVTGGRCVFVRDEREQAEFELRAVSDYLDFEPVLRLEEEYLRERVTERSVGPSF